MDLQLLDKNGISFYDVVIHKYTYSEQAMQIGRKITASFVYKDNSLHDKFTKREYIIYKQNKYWLSKQPSIEQKGMLSDNSELKGAVKYNCEFVSEDVILANTFVCDVNYGDLVVQTRNGSRTFYFFGTVREYVAMLNANLQFNLPSSGWNAIMQSGFVDKGITPERPIAFRDNTIEDALKTLYDTYKVPYYIQGTTIVVGKPILEVGHIFQFGQGVGLKNNDRIAKGNKVITRLIGKGSPDNLPFRYPNIKDPLGNVIDHPYYRENLMPTVYVNAVRDRVLGINPNAPLIDYIDANNTYPTPINPSLPSAHPQSFDYIKPTIEEIEYNGIRIDQVKAIEYFDNNVLIDDIDKESGEVRQPHFKIQFYPMGFDIWASAAVTGEMILSMKSGATQGSEFKVAVNDEDFKNSFYTKDANGKIIFDPNLPTRDLVKFPKSNDQSIWITVYKDIDTWGINAIMPNKWQQPRTGDKFVILQIELPQYYIDQAQLKLDADMEEYLRANNFDQYEYPLSFDEGFLELNQSILAQIGTNILVPFKYRGDDDVKRLSVQSISIQYDEATLPKYDIKLTDEIVISLNQVGQVRDDVNDLSSTVVQQTIKGGRQANAFYQGIKKVEQGVFDSEGNNRVNIVEALVLKANLALIGQPANNFGLQQVSIRFVGLDKVNIQSGSLYHFDKTVLDTYWQTHDPIWNIQSRNFTGLDPTKDLYVYIRANKINTDATWHITDQQIKYNDDPNVYHFLWGQAVIVDEARGSYATYGLTAVMGGHLSTMVVQSPNFKLTESEFYGSFFDFVNSRYYMGEGATFIANSLTIRRPNKADIEIGGFADQTETDINGLGQDVQDAQGTANDALNEVLAQAYLKAAIHDGTTTIGGGLVLGNILAVTSELSSDSKRPITGALVGSIQDTGLPFIFSGAPDRKEDGTVDYTNVELSKRAKKSKFWAAEDGTGRFSCIEGELDFEGYPRASVNAYDKITGEITDRIWIDPNNEANINTLQGQFFLPLFETTSPDFSGYVFDLRNNLGVLPIETSYTLRVVGLLGIMVGTAYTDEKIGEDIVDFYGEAEYDEYGQLGNYSVYFENRRENGRSLPTDPIPNNAGVKLGINITSTSDPYNLFTRNMEINIVDDNIYKDDIESAVYDKTFPIYPSWYPPETGDPYSNLRVYLGNGYYEIGCISSRYYTIEFDSPDIQVEDMTFSPGTLSVSLVCQSYITNLPNNSIYYKEIFTDIFTVVDGTHPRPSYRANVDATLLGKNGLLVRNYSGNSSNHDNYIRMIRGGGADKNVYLDFNNLIITGKTNSLSSFPNLALAAKLNPTNMTLYNITGYLANTTGISAQWLKDGAYWIYGLPVGYNYIGHVNILNSNANDNAIYATSMEMIESTMLILIRGFNGTLFQPNAYISLFIYKT